MSTQVDAGIVLSTELPDLRNWKLLDNEALDEVNVSIIISLDLWYLCECLLC